jgi:hypothetical protein
MSEKPLVVRSVNNADANRCVDVFRRPDGSYGFEEFRRDAEDGRGWFPIGGHKEVRWDSEAAAWTAALERVTWLSEAS